MANKARYYGVITVEQKELRERAMRNPVINREELTEYSLYSAMGKISNIDETSVQKALPRIRNVIMNEGFIGAISVYGAEISDGYNTYVLTKSERLGIHIVKQTHAKRNRR